MESENLDEFAIPEEAYAKLSDPEVIQKYVDEGKTFREIIGYSDETMDHFYQSARRLYENHKFQEACDAFLFLTTLDPFVPAYWLGMGLCEQINEDYQSALVAYGMAILSYKEDPYPHYYSAACYYALDDYENALRSLETALEYATEEEHTEIKQLSEKAKQSLHQKI